ncbi:hypothetical protein StrepF001_27975 [Streptomyces sp. F001]|nr:hypothetical protein StrepF001_27975 [Streptomyces sp. F001]
MTTHLAAPEPPHLPPMRTIGELRAALVTGYCFPGDADDFEAELARETSHCTGRSSGGVCRSRWTRCTAPPTGSWSCRCTWPGRG